MNFQTLPFDENGEKNQQTESISMYIFNVCRRLLNPLDFKITEMEWKLKRENYMKM